jgi:hypothetical protein
MKAKMTVGLDDTVRTGLGLVGSLNSSAVLNGNVTVDVPKRLFKSKLDTPTSEHQVLSLRSRPFTYNFLMTEKPTEVFKTQLCLLPFLSGQLSTLLWLK